MDFGGTYNPISASGDFIIEFNVEMPHDVDRNLSVYNQLQLLSANSAGAMADIPLKNVSITTSGGVFSSNSLWQHCGRSFSDKNINLRLHPTRSKFESNAKPKLRWWVLPLINFVNEGGFHYEGLESHPLRLRRAVPAKEVLSDSRQVIEQFILFIIPGLLHGQWKENLLLLRYCLTLMIGLNA